MFWAQQPLSKREKQSECQNHYLNNYLAKTQIAKLRHILPDHE